MQSERLLIINADDLGMTPGVTRGILELARLGIVSSASLMPNFPCSAEALAEARQVGLDVGLHLNLCTGAPLSPAQAIPHLVAADGRFVRAGAIMRRHHLGRLALDEVEREWRAQIEWCLERGMRPSHLDSHCHLHALPRLYPLTLRLARRYGIVGVRGAAGGFIWQARGLYRLRGVVRRSRRTPDTPPGADYFTVLSAVVGLRTSRPLQALLRALPPGLIELVCHPGHVDAELRRTDILTDQREREWLLLTRPVVRATLQEEGIRLVSWAEALSGH